MGSQAVAIFSVVLVIFYGKGNEACCPTLTLRAGLYFTRAPVAGEQGEMIGVACDLGYVPSPGGSNSGECGNKCAWSWGKGSSEMLQCNKGCLAPNLTQGVEYVTGDANTSYSIGSTVSLKCSTSYGVKVGSSKGTCDGTTFLWTWIEETQLECDPACPAPALTTGVEFESGKLPEYTVGDAITLKCSSGYTSTDGSESATCTSSNTWQWSGSGMLRCSQACSAPNLTTGVEYVSDNSTSTYLKGSIVSLKCSTQYGYKSGSYNATCGNTLTWIWDAGTQLECDPACPPPTLPIGTEFASGSSLEYTITDVIVVRCSNGYASAGGGASGVCLSNNTWQWDGAEMLLCLPTCHPPAVGVNATISPSFTKNTYLLNDTIQFECVGGYVPLSGSATGVCSSMNTWTWLAGTRTSLSCVIAPPYKERVSSTFKPSTCQSYVTRSAPTSSTCLFSCLNDGYCRGYAFDGGVCYVDRPFIEATMNSSMACMSR